MGMFTTYAIMRAQAARKEAQKKAETKVEPKVEAKVEEPKKEPKKEAKKTYTVKAGDTLSEIAQKFNTTISRLVELNGINNPNLIQTGQVLKLDDNAKEKTYTVKAGDTLGEIAEKFGASVYEIAEKNNIKDINIIYVGQVLKI
jgi:lysozyme